MNRLIKMVSALISYWVILYSASTYSNILTANTLGHFVFMFALTIVYGFLLFEASDGSLRLEMSLSGLAFLVVGLVSFAIFTEPNEINGIAWLLSFLVLELSMTGTVKRNG